MIPKRVQNILEQHQLTVLEFESGSTPTSVTAAEQVGCKVGQIAKSLLIKTKSSGYALVICSGDLRIDTKKLKQILGEKWRMATAEETLDITAYKPGAVCPFALIDLKIFIDTHLNEYSLIYPAAGTDASAVPISYEKLQRITSAEEIDVCVKP